MAEKLTIIHIPEPQMGAVILVPPEALLTEESRGLLPEQLITFRSNYEQCSRISCFQQQLLQDDWETAGRMMEKDIFHEPYRKHLIS